MKWKEKSNCETEEILQQLIDGELGPNEAKSIENHLLSCKDCQSIVEEKKGLINQLNNALNLGRKEQVEIPEFNENKITAIDFQKKVKVYWWSAAAVVLMLISFFLIRNTEEEEVNLEIVFQEMYNEVDANKPWHQQASVIYILNESGEIIDKIEI